MRYQSPEGKLFISEETTSGSVKTTYLGTARLADEAAYDSIATLTAQDIWKIQKIVETTSGQTVTTVFEFPTDATGRRSTEQAFVWDDRATLIYK